MKTKIFAACVLAVALVSLLGQAAIGGIIDVTNPGFENPVLGTEWTFYETAPMGGANLLPTVPGWEFSASPLGGSSEAGILSSSGIGPWGAQAFGNQCVAFSSGATVSQTINGFAAGTATFSFYAQASGTGTPTLTVKLDGTPLTFSGVPSVAPRTSMVLYTSDSIAVGAGAHTLLFTPTAWTYFDAVSATNAAVPEPASIVTLLTAGLIGLLAYAWRKQR